MAEKKDGTMRSAGEKEVLEFRAASKRYLKEVTRTKETAHQALVELGTHTKSGKIAAKYNR